MQKRRLVDIQYYYETDSVLFHEIIDGKRVYNELKNPTLDYAIVDLNKRTPHPQDFFIPVSDVKWQRCSYINRYKEQGLSLGYTEEQIHSFKGEMYNEFKKIVRHSPYIYFGDNSITFQEKLRYVNTTYKDQIDETLPAKVLSFDIEVHDDFSPEFVEINNLLKSHGILISDKMVDKISNFIKYDEISLLSKEISLSKNDDIYSTAKMLLGSIVTKYRNGEIQEARDEINDYLRLIEEERFTLFTGFPDESIAPAKIDAISAYDNIEKKMYMYLLKVDVDIRDSDLNTLETCDIKINEYLKMVKLRIFINSDKLWTKEYPELVESYNNETSNFHKNCNEENYLLTLKSVQEIFPIIGEDRFNEIINITTEVFVFDNELSLMEKFFKDVRFTIQPNFILAHNNKFDFLTLYNRLVKHGKTPELYFNQVGPFFTDEDLSYEDMENIQKISIRVDYKAPNNKQDKTYFKVPGVVWLDTQLMIAKTSQRERDFSLNAVSRDFLKESKFQYEGVIQELYKTNPSDFVIYSAVDTMLVDQLNNQMQLVANFQTIIDGTFSSWSEHSLKSVYLTNLTKYETLFNQKLITRNNLNIPNYDEREKDENDGPGFSGAYVTDLEAVKSYGLVEDAYDCDASTFYPRNIIDNNIMTDKLIGQFEDLEFYREYLIISKMTFASKYLGTSSRQVIYDKL